jgi:CBS domain-containing protein
MRIKDILRQKGTEVVTIAPMATVHDAIDRLNQHNIGALIVAAKNGAVVGIISERDILRETSERCDRLKVTLVGDIMTRDVIIGVPDDELDYVMAVMTKNRIRHLPVMNGPELVGMISIGDVVRAHLDETEFENRMLKDYIHGVAHSPAAR